MRGRASADQGNGRSVGRKEVTAADREKGGVQMSRNRAKKAVFWMLLAGLLFAGCGSAKKSMDAAIAVPAETASVESYGGKEGIYEYAYEEAVAEEAAAEFPASEGSGTAGGNAASSQVSQSRKLIRTIYMTVETESFETLIPWVEGRTAELGGYMESTSIYNGSSYNGRSTKTAEMAIRIPKDRMEDFVTSVEELSNVILREENVEDVTLQYVDLESHKKVLRTEQERLLELLGQAESIEEVILLEERLSEVRYELERMESQLRTYDNQIEYATLHLSIQEVERLTPVKERSRLEKMGTGFLESLTDLGRFLVDFGVEFVIALPYLIFLGICAAVGLCLGRKWLKKRKRRREADPWGVNTRETKQEEAQDRKEEGE